MYKLDPRFEFSSTAELEELLRTDVLFLHGAALEEFYSTKTLHSEPKIKDFSE